MTYKEKTIEALKQLGGHAYLSDIYEAFENLNDNEILPKSYKAIIRATLEHNSSDSFVFNGKEDLFYSVDGIGNGHWGLRTIDDEYKYELTQEDDEFSEGKLQLKKHLTKERNPKLISRAKKIFAEKHNNQLYCEICGFNFNEKYASLGDGFIEAHHIKPVSQMEEDEKTKISDLVMVCSNCHSMIHRHKPWLSKKEDLKKILR
ncbi:MAG: HNH endonuclease [Clostridia bacterium]|nr:HNH endonuclease [Clostridia bacterium]